MAQLRRDLHLIDAIGVGIGAIVGAGIFVVTAEAARIAGPALLLGLLLAGIAATCNALSSAQLAATYPQAGGTYEYGYQTLHPLAGFSAGWMFLTSKLTAGGTVALGFGAYVSRLFPALDPRWIGAAAVVALTVANLFGVKKAGRLNGLIVLFTLGTLLLFAAVGAPSVHGANFQPFAPHGVSSVLQAAALLFFAYTGYARIATLGEEVAEPEKTIPRAITWTIVIAVVLYAAVATVAIGAAGTEVVGATRAPLEAAARVIAGDWLATIMVVGASTAMLGVLLSQVLGISRMMFAMSRRDDLPAPLQAVHERHQIPHVGVVLTGSIILALTLFGSLIQVLSTAAFTILLYYSIANVAALRMPKERKLFPDLIPIVGLLSCLLLAASISLSTATIGLAVLAIGLLWRAVWHRLSKE